MPTTSSHAYMAAETDSEKGELDAFLDQSILSGDGTFWYEKRPRWLPPHKVLAVTPWILSAFFATLSLILLFKGDYVARTTPFGSYELGFSTDIGMSLSGMNYLKHE